MPGFLRSMTDINCLDRMNLNHLLLLLPGKQHQGPSIFVVLFFNNQFLLELLTLVEPWAVQMLIGEERA